jgi:hypothetical protein
MIPDHQDKDVARTTRRVAQATALAIGVIVAAAILAPAGALARDDRDGLRELARSTFRLLPGKDRVEVVVDVTLTNQQPSVIRNVPCPGRPSATCRQRVSYYFDEWGYLAVQPGARDVRFSGRGVKGSVEKRNEGWVGYVVRFPRIDQGETARFRVRYQLPTGRPRSPLATRITDAYAHFCWHGQPTDSGSVSALLPGGYETETYGGAVRSRDTRKTTSIRARGDAGRFGVCTDAFDRDGLLRTESVSPSGQTVVVEGWPEDPDWSRAVTEGIGGTLPRLEEIIGIAFPLDGLTVRQVASQALGAYAGDFIPKRGQVRVGERLDDRALVAHELAHAWFNDGTLEGTWLAEGYADWAGRAAAGERCPIAGDYPSKGGPTLSTWRFLGADPSREDRAVIDYQYAAACQLVQAVADHVGPERMRRLTTAVLLREPKYATWSGRSGEEAPVPDWREWLDAVDEIGLVPAGETDLELAEGWLIEQGIARSRDMRGRAEARAAYHAAAEDLGTLMPMVIPTLMDGWRFDRALDAVGLATEVAGMLESVQAGGLSPAELGGFRLRLAGADSSRALTVVRDDLRAALAAAGIGTTAEAAPASRDDRGDGRDAADTHLIGSH